MTDSASSIQFPSGSPPPPGVVPGPTGSLEAVLRLADAMPQLVWIGLPDGGIEYFNARWYEYFRVDEIDRPQERERWVERLHPDDRESTQAAWCHSTSSGESYDVEYRLRRHDGEYRWHLARGVPTRDEAGRTFRWIGTCTDIHDRKIAEAALKKAKEDSESASRSKDQFLSIVSHELRTPLSAILGWTQLLEMDVLDEAERREAVQTIKQQAKAQTQLIEDLLDVSRIINGKFHMRFQEVELGRLVAAASNTVRPIATENGVKLIQGDTDHTQIVRGDPQRLQQVVTNLLVNAIKFTPKGGSIEVTVTRRSDQACVSVIDTGAGIPVDQIEAIFERFKRVGTDALRDKGGLGLGLSIVKHVVDGHHGTVHATSQGVGHGSRFEMCLPLVATEPTVNALSSPTPDATFSAVELTGVRVLVVDDEESARTVIAAALRKAGSDVATARDAAEAWDALGRQSFDVLVSDLAMPGHSGVNLIGRVRGCDRAFKNIAAIALTGFASVDDQTQALAAGFNVHVSKPIEPSELIRRVGALTRKT